MGRRELQRELERLESAALQRRPAPPPSTLGERLLGWARWLRHPVRAGAMAMAALALAWGIATTAGLSAAMLGAVAGVAAGELLARTKTRLIALVAGLAAFVTLGWWAAELSTQLRAVPAMIGPGAALGLGSVLRMFVASLGVVTLVRVLAARHKALVGLELAFVGASVASMFASHREGVIARPLWLSDWAWQHGYDPAEVLLCVGALAVVVLAALLIAESERRVSAASIAGLGGLVLLALLFLQVEGLPQPQANADLGLTESKMGDPPKPTPEGGQQGGGQDSEKQDPNEGERPEDSQGGQGGGQKQDQEQDPQQGGQGGQQQDQQQDPQGGQGQQQQQQDPQGGQGQQQQQQEPQGGQGQQQQQQQQQDQQGGQGQQQQQQQQQQQDPQGGQGQQQQQDNSEQPDVEDQQVSDGSAPAPMAVVLLGDDYSPPSGGYYFRQDAWSHFNGSRLVAPRRFDVDRDIVRSFPARPIEVPDPPPEREASALVHAEVVLLAKHAQPFALDSPLSLQPEQNPNPKRFLRAYSFVSRAPTYAMQDLLGALPGDPEWNEAQWEFYTAVPEDPRYGELAAELIEDLRPEYADDPLARALAIKLWMDQELTYSTAERHAGVPDPTGDFLFGNKIGYCVHFAHAAVYMWRSLGIPARVGTGYLVTEEQRRGSTIVIRGGDAHAWPELYLDGVGWVILDISAAQNLDPPGTPVPEDLSDLLGEMARNERDEQEQPGEQPVEQRSFGRDLGLSLLLLLNILLLCLYVAKSWRRHRPRFAKARKQPRVAYRAMVDTLVDAGFVRRYGETREAFGRRLSSAAPCLAGLTSMHVAAAMGNPEVPMNERPEFDPKLWREGIARLEGELERSVPRWRRILGALDPTTVLRAR